MLNSNDDALQKLVSFPWIFAFVFKNYRYLDNFGNVWIYQKGEEIIIPKELSLEPNFAKWYLITIEKN